MDVPELPESLNDHDLDPDEVRELWNALVAEVINPIYLNRTHGHRRTYDAGCRGPMCSKGVREHGRRRSGASGPKGKYCSIDPMIEHFRPIAELLVMQAMDRIVVELTA